MSKTECIVHKNCDCSEQECVPLSTCSTCDKLSAEVEKLRRALVEILKEVESSTDGDAMSEWVAFAIAREALGEEEGGQV